MQKISEKNVLLGNWTCPEGGKADVYQTKKAGRHFYTRCDCCGLQQGTGEKRQQAIWDNAVFFDKTTVHRPSNVSMGAVVGDPEPEKTEKTETELLTDSDFNPNEPDETEQQPQVESGLKKAIVPGVIFLLAVGAGLWMQ